MRRSGAAALVTLILAIAALVYTFTVGGHSPQLGLDLQGGTSVVLAAKAGQNASSDQLDRAISIIRRRVDGLGVAEPEITRQGDFIVVSLPGVKDAQHAIELVGRTAKLQFRPTCSAQTLPTNLPDSTYTQALDPSVSGLCVKPTEPAPGSPTTTTSTTESTTSTTAAAAAGDTATTVPGETTTTAPGDTTTTEAPSTLPCGTAGDKASVTPDNEPIIATVDVNKDGTVDGCEVLGPVALGGEAVSSAAAAIPQGSWVVELQLKDSGLTGFN
jgi:preprotein translocase subunit SecD